MGMNEVDCLRRMYDVSGLRKEVPGGAHHVLLNEH